MSVCKRPSPVAEAPANAVDGHRATVIGTPDRGFEYDRAGEETRDEERPQELVGSG